MKKKSIIAIFLGCSFYAVAQNEIDKKAIIDPLLEKFKTELSSNKGYAALPYQVDADGFGYVIMLDDKIIIEQPFVPGVPGFVRFKNQGQAKKVGNQMVKKLNSYDFAPHITARELDSLQIDITPKK